MKKIIWFIAFLGIVQNGFSQKARVLDKPSGILVQMDYGLEVPFGQLADRFGAGFGLGVSPVYMTKKQWLIGVESKFYFGGEVKEDVVANLRTSEGDIIGQDKEFGFVALNQRGYFLGVSLGKILAFSESGRSGVRVNVNGGIFRHKIRLDDSGNLPQISGAYRLGYDRLTYGFGLTEFIGYQYLSSNKLVNFYAGFEFTQGFTRNRRSFNYDTGVAETAPRRDMLWGLQFGWILPLYDQNSTERFY